VTERCIVRIKFTPVGTGTEVRRAVGGFLRYVQHRDLHPDSRPLRPTPEVAGLLKYVAYRDRANARAELFGPHGPIGTQERKQFADFVARSIEDSRPELFRTRDGRLTDRRRAVSRFILSPERADGLDLEALTRVAMDRLDSDLGMAGVRWIAAIHRNTKHHHVHLVVAGMVEDGQGGYRRADVTKPRLAAIKDAVALEIERQRAELKPLMRPVAGRGNALSPVTVRPAAGVPVARPALVQRLQVRPLARIRVAPSVAPKGSGSYRQHSSSLLALRAVARRYSRQMQREAEREARRLGMERAA
jgi:hypothetical protein